MRIAVEESATVVTRQHRDAIGVGFAPSELQRHATKR